VSCNTTSSDEFAKTIPVSQPNINKTINPRAHNIGVSYFTALPCSVVNHLNTFTPVGTAITIVAEEKYDRVSISIPTTNIW